MRNKKKKIERRMDYDMNDRNQSNDRARIPFKRASIIWGWNCLMAIPILLLLTLLLYMQNGQVYWGNLIFCLISGASSLLFFLPSLRERAFFGKLERDMNSESGQFEETKVQEVQDLQIVFSTFVQYSGHRAFRIKGRIRNAAGEEITVRSPLYAVGKSVARSYDFRSGSFLEHIRMEAYTSSAFRGETYYVRVFASPLQSR